MISTSFSIYHLEYFMAIVIRVLGTMVTAPLFGHRAVPSRVKLFLSIGISLAVISVRPYTPLDYTTTIGFTLILLKELAVGLTIGFLSNITMGILSLAGQFIDREMGFTMVSNFDPSTNTSVTITAELYNYLVMLLMLCSNLHFFFISAVTDSFDVIPIGGAVFNMDSLYATVLEFIGQYFIIALRISMPVFISIMLLNVILGILAKAAPQMNMFVIGMQLKVITGLFVIFITIGFLPNITDFLFTEVKTVVYDAIRGMY